MSKKPQLWEKLKKNQIPGEPPNHDLHNRVRGKRNYLDVINSCSETSLPIQNSYNRLQTHANIEEVKCKKDYKYDAFGNLSRNKHTPSKTGKDCDNSDSEHNKLSSEYIDSLVCNIKELRNRVKYIEEQCVCRTVIDDNSPTYQHQTEEKQIGDYNAPNFSKWHKNHKDIQNNHDENSSSFAWIDNNKVPFHHKISSYVKNVSDHQKSIYTANGHTIQDTHFKVSKNQKSKSNAATIMSLYSTSKSNFVKVNPLTDSKNFQAATEAFIEQAEELKGKICYILECCGYNDLSSMSDDHSESIILSDCKSSSRECEDIKSDHDLKLLFGAVSSQYSEIMNSLVFIEKQIKILNKHKRSKPSSKGSICIPIKTTNNSNKVHTHGRSHMSRTAMIKKHVAEDTKLSRTLTKKPHTTKVKSASLGAGKNNHTDKILEPVVMVYEPILPECENCSSICICKYCGQEINSCGGCSKDTIIKPRKGTCRNKKEDENEKTQKYGYVVTYTPDISVDLNVTPSTSKASTKTKPKKKKRIIPCLWF